MPSVAFDMSEVYGDINQERGNYEIVEFNLKQF